MRGSYIVLILFAFLVDGMFGETDKVKSVKEGDLVILNTDITKGHQVMKWYFNDILIAMINGNSRSSCLYDGEGERFKDRLAVDYETGSLIITEITTEHAGRYEAEFIRSESTGKKEILKRTFKCDSTKITNKTNIVGEIIKTFRLNVIASDLNKNKNEAQISPQDKENETSAVVGISVAVQLAAAVVFAAVGLKFYCLRMSKKGKYHLLILN
ncbi:uncharacterized protein [Garra rufa]|uniref:uncharacterized protein n=1 Tax=Garra rufa TaxID=137080 RepID=UPI003CCEE0A6